MKYKTILEYETVGIYLGSILIAGAFIYGISQQNNAMKKAMERHAEQTKPITIVVTNYPTLDAKVDTNAISHTGIR
jgi:hypothetical protein